MQISQTKIRTRFRIVPCTKRYRKRAAYRSIWKHQSVLCPSHVTRKVLACVHLCLGSLRRHFVINPIYYAYKHTFELDIEMTITERTTSAASSVGYNGFGTKHNGNTTTTATTACGHKLKTVAHRYTATATFVCLCECAFAEVFPLLLCILCLCVCIRVLFVLPKKCAPCAPQ